MTANWPNQANSQKNKKLNSGHIYFPTFMKFGMEVALKPLHMACKFYGNWATTLPAIPTNPNFVK